MFVADAFVLMLIFLPKKASGLVEAPYHGAEKYKKSAMHNWMSRSKIIFELFSQRPSIECNLDILYI